MTNVASVARRGGSSLTSHWLAKLVLAAVGVAVLVVTPVSMMMSSVQAPYYLHIAILTLLYASVAMGMNVPIRTGSWPVGQAAFMATGGYTTAVLSAKEGWPLALGVLAAGVTSGVLAFAFGRVTLRVSGTYFVLATFAFAEVVRLIIVNQTSVLGGSGGISGMPTLDLLAGMFGFTTTATQLLTYYYVALVLLLLTIIVVLCIYRSAVGQTFDAMRVNLRLAQSHGVDTVRYRIFAFTLSGVIAGLVGALLVNYVHLASPTMFTYVLSVEVLMMNIVGGTHRLLGPLLGAIVIAPLPEVLRGVGATYAQLGYGVVIIMIMLLWPAGLISAGRSLRDAAVRMTRRGTS
jgi:branched-chain amino acid transport system permease protein